MSEDRPTNAFRIGRAWHVPEANICLWLFLGRRYDLSEPFEEVPSVFGLIIYVEKPRPFFRLQGRLYVQLWPLGGAMRFRCWLRPNLLRWAA
jgi:hypothetical protein